MKLLKKTNK